MRRLTMALVGCGKVASSILLRVCRLTGVQPSLGIGHSLAWWGVALRREVLWFVTRGAAFMGD
jgi:hypothetical protein